MNSSEDCCDACGAENPRYECSMCGDFVFCSMECSDELALAHHKVCYDKEGAVEPILATLGIPLAMGAAAVEQYLEHSDFTPAALVIIAASSSSARRNKRRTQRLERHKRHKKTNRALAAHHRKQAALHQKTLDDPTATAAQKREARKQLNYHSGRASHYDKRAAVHKEGEVRRKAQLAPEEAAE